MINQTPQSSSDKDLVLPGFDENDEDDDVFDPKPPARRFRNKRTLIIISVVLVVVILAALGLIALARRAPRFSYTTQQAQQGKLALSVNATGPVEGNVYNVDFSNSGTLTAIDVSIGQHVSQGQTLAQLNVTSAQTGQSQTITLTAPHAGVIATINGSVGGVPGVPTTVGTTSVGSNAAFMQIVDLSSLQVYANVNQADIAGVKDGQSAQFTVSAYGTRQFSGTVKAVSPLGQTTSGIVTYTVIIQVNMNSLSGAQLLPGMAATTAITTQTRSNVLLIPVGATSFAQSATSSGATDVPSDIVSQSAVQSVMTQAQQMAQTLENSQPSLAQDDPTPSYILEYVNQNPVLKPVVLGLTDGTSYEVLAGVSSNDSVIVASQQVKRATGSTGTAGGSGGVFRGIVGG